MSERRTNDAEVERIVGFYKYTTQEVSLIKETQKWSGADFLFAIDRVDVVLSGHPQEIRDQLRSLYKTMRNEREAADERAASETVSTQRHVEISRRLDELKKPHWSSAWNFWMTAAILILTLILVLLAFRH